MIADKTCQTSALGVPPRRPSIAPLQTAEGAASAQHTTAAVDVLEPKKRPKQVQLRPTKKIVRLPPLLFLVKKHGRVTEAPLAKVLARKIVKQKFDEIPDADPKDIEMYGGSIWQEFAQEHQRLTQACWPDFLTRDTLVLTRLHVRELTTRISHPKHMPHYLYWLFQSPSCPKTCVAYTPQAREDLFFYLDVWGMSAARKFVLKSPYQQLWDRWHAVSSGTILDEITLKVIDAVIDATDDEDPFNLSSGHSDASSSP